MTGPADRPNADQAEYWNSVAGRKWILYEEKLDSVLGSVEGPLLDRADPRPGERVLEVGCGTGATTRTLAERVGPGGSVLAVDISALLMERARERTAGLAQVAFVLADAQVHGFDPGSVDLVVSRFGVMFFADPVAAFRNLLGSLRPGGRLCVVAWGPIAENPWFRIPRDAAIERLGSPAPTPPDAPGPMAFADRERVRRLLADAGFSGVAAEPISVALHWPGDLDALAELATNLGPAARLLRERDGGPADEAAIAEAVSASLAHFAGPDGFRIPASLNLVTAVRP